MRKALLSIAAVAFLSSGASAQITLADTSFNNPLGTVDTFRYINSGYNTGATTLPDDNRLARPSGYVWNFSGLFFHATKMRIIQHVAATGHDYANRTVDTLNHKTHPTTSGSAPSFVYMPEYITDITPSVGIEEHGINIPTMLGYSLSGLPGGVMTDSLKIPAQTAMYYETTISNNLEQRIKLKFPVTNTTATWVNTYQDTIHGTMTFAAGGFIDTPIHIKTEVTETKDVVGYGKLRFKKPIGMTPLFTDTLNILQVRCTLQIRDYYYIGTNDADSITLSYIGVSGQGTQRVYFYDEYYRRGDVEPVITWRFTDATYMNANADRSDAHIRNLNPTEVAVITSLSNINVYPNPVKDGAITVDLNDTKGGWKYNVYSVNGQLIQSGALNNAGKNKVQLPANLAAGTYFMNLENGSENITKTLTISE